MQNDGGGGGGWWERTMGRLVGVKTPTISPEDQATKSANNNQAIIDDLQTRLDHQTMLRDRYKENVDKLGKRPECKNQALQAFAGWKKAEEACRTLRGKIDSLTTVTNGMHDMRDNARMFEAMKQSNDTSARLAGKLDVDDVADVMSKARTHMDDHREISDELAGKQLMEPVDEDDEYEEMMKMIAEGVGGGGTNIAVGASSSSSSSSRPAMTRDQAMEYDAAKLDEEERMLQLLASMKSKTPGPSQNQQRQPEKKM